MCNACIFFFIRRTGSSTDGRTGATVRDVVAGDDMFGADSESVAGMAQTYMKFRNPGHAHETEATRDVSALFLAVRNQVRAYLQVCS
jgi:hypothetical protein